ncbi:MAG: hypothetical protein K5673_05955 [Lachnospiraceae bacterium]|nr:hypothetical protein [Lachnospiraceae bacterium]
MKEAIKNLLPYGYVTRHSSPGTVFGDESHAYPEIYNARGERMRVFYLKNSLNAHTPYSMVAGRISDRILWDRFNQGLPIHFYSHRDMFDISPVGARRFGVLRESESIVPADYDRVLNSPDTAARFERIFTHSERILDKYANASFVPAYGVWYGTARYGGEMSDTAYERKVKDISVISSDKTVNEYHRLRLDLARRAAACPGVDGYGRAFGRYIEHKADALTDYRYSIVVENGVFNNYFTEKILDCFASMTVPVYIGAPNIGDFFNTDGIITLSVNDTDKLESVLSGCTAEDYAARLDAIRDNYNRVQGYLDFESYILDNYGELFTD